MPTSSAGVANVNELLRFGVREWAEEDNPIDHIRDIAHLLALPLVFDPAWQMFPFIMGRGSFHVLATPVYVTQRQIAAAVRAYAELRPFEPLTVIAGLSVRVASTGYADADVIEDPRPSETIVQDCVAELGDQIVFKDVGGAASETDWQQLVMNELRRGQDVMLAYAYSAVANFIFGDHFIPERLRMDNAARRRVRSLINTISAIHDPRYERPTALAAAAGASTPRDDSAAGGAATPETVAPGEDAEVDAAAGGPAAGPPQPDMDFDESDFE
ncbi:hypothetical protein FNF31_05981 [Cafeteria roenbergensis]|nr:hypothetical protein FNF31_05981 [Cafeteria roenbergensis]